MKTLKDLFLEELEHVYDTEQRIVKALPQMAGAAISPRLRQMFQSHLKETEGHLEKLGEVFGCMDENAVGQTCEPIKGLLKEGGVTESAGRKIVQRRDF